MSIETVSRRVIWSEESSSSARPAAADAIGHGYDDGSHRDPARVGDSYGETVRPIVRPKIDSNSIESTAPTGGFLQTAVSDAPRTTSRAYLPTYYGAQPIQH